MADTINRSLYANVEGGGKLLTSLYTNIDGSYKQLSAMYSNINGASKQIFPYAITNTETTTTGSTTAYKWNMYSVTTEWGWTYSSSSIDVTFNEGDYITEMSGFSINSSGEFIFEGYNNWMVGYDMGDFTINGPYWIVGTGSSAYTIYEGPADVYEMSNTSYHVNPGSCMELCTRQEESAGGFISTVTSTSRSAYPDDGSQDGYYYIYQGTTTVPGSTTTQTVTYSQIKAIQSTGTQHINTGFTANQNTRIIISMEPLSVANVSSGIGHVSYGAGNPSTNSGYENLIWDGQYEFNYGNQTQYASFTAKVGDKLIIDQNKNVVSISINGEQQTLTFNTTSFASSSPLVLFALNRGGDASTYRGISKLYYCKIYDNGTLVRDYVPVSGSNGSVGLYDLVNKKFYGNSGTGTFTAIT